MKRWLFAVGLLMAGVLEVTADEALDTRMAAVAEQSPATLAYRESRSSDLFSEPVTFVGRLAWDPETQTLTKWVDEPEKARLSITPNHVEMMTGDGRTRRVAIARRPELGVFVAGLRALLSGDTEGLYESFGTSYSENDDGTWHLVLEPLDRRTAKRIDSLGIEGKGDRIRVLATHLANGESQRMTILDSPEPVADD